MTPAVRNPFGAALMSTLIAALIAATLFALPRAHAADPTDAAEAARLHTLFDERWETLMRAYPEWATYVGDHRFGDRLRDASAQAVAAEFTASRQALAKARAIRREALSPQDRTSLDVFIHRTEDELRYETFVGFRSMSIGALGGFQTEFADLMRATPMARRAEVEQLLARQAAFPARVEQELARLREGMALRWVPPRAVLERALAQIDAQLAATGEASPYFEPFKRLGSDIGAAEQEFDDSFAAFIEHLNTDPKFFHASPEALLAGYRDIAKRIDPELPRLFADLPRAPYGVRAMPSHFTAEQAEFYSGPALDGSRPGWFNANAQAFRSRPIWGMETLTAHEGVPGHHLQIARATELGELPKFRRADGYEAYGEGWAVYAETLGFELGLYQDPYSRFGHLQWQAFRAARLVVDTGIHAFGWSRQRAIDFMVERTGAKPAFVASEVDRYTSWPGQALAYMIGKLKIVELRDRARAKLDERFDIRRFHSVVLDQGSVPLPVLERAVEGWIATGGGAAQR